MLTVDPAQHPATLIVQRHGGGADKVLNVGPGGSGGVGIQLSTAPPPPPARAAAARPAMMAPRAAAAAPPPPMRRTPLGPAVPPPRVDEEELLDTMNEFANPLKKSAQPRDEYGGYEDEGSADGSGDGGSEGSGSEEGDSQDGSEYSDEGGGGGGRGGGGGPAPAFGAYEDEAPAPDKPSEGYRTLDEEKSDIMFKLQRLQRQGVKGMRAFTPYSDIRDMRAELNRIRTELDLERSVKFQRKILMAIVSALEWGNGKFNPFDLELDGWSEQMHTSVQSNMEYDSIFEELWYKYKGKVSTPPEIRLLLMVGGSAMMFHMTKAMMKSALPNLMGNPEMMASMMKGMGGGAGGGMPGAGGGMGGGGMPGLGALFGGGPAMMGQSSTEQQQSQQQNNGARREMRGPGFDVSGLTGGGGGGGLGGLMGGLGGGGGGAGLGGLMGGLMGGGLPGMGGVSASQLPSGLPQPPPPPSGHMKPEATRRDRGFDSSAALGGMGGGGGDDDMSDRLSDVVSDDLGSVPDDLASVRSGDSGRSGSVKNVRIAVGPPARRGAKKQKVSAKKVITI